MCIRDRVSTQSTGLLLLLLWMKKSFTTSLNDEMNVKPNLTLLPREILIAICEYISERSLASVCRVCTLLRDLLHDSLFWKRKVLQQEGRSRFWTFSLQQVQRRLSKEEEVPWEKFFKWMYQKTSHWLVEEESFLLDSEDSMSAATHKVARVVLVGDNMRHTELELLTNITNLFYPSCITINETVKQLSFSSSTSASKPVQKHFQIEDSKIQLELETTFFDPSQKKLMRKKASFRRNTNLVVFYFPAGDRIAFWKLVKIIIPSCTQEFEFKGVSPPCIILALSSQNNTSCTTTQLKHSEAEEYCINEGYRYVHCSLQSPRKIKSLVDTAFTLSVSHAIHVQKIEKRDLGVRVRHMGAQCQACHQQSIEGVRFRCLSCPNYDLCQSCYLTQKYHNFGHLFTKISSQMSSSHMLLRSSVEGNASEKTSKVRVQTRGTEKRKTQEEPINRPSSYFNLIGKQFFEVITTCHHQSKDDGELSFAPNQVVKIFGGDTNSKYCYGLLHNNIGLISMSHVKLLAQGKRQRYV
eukprot:TRINITY_DN7128_c0_g1_i1.p1 TRINITY_DN7128_c0_g1~~TRINITY_DN7128_c0_g1_i1.p1  ORF type:complete len:524 (-),score=91.53 TRINITY_DN7128_c0_g1_i1:76-1647(-)